MVELGSLKIGDRFCHMDSGGRVIWWRVLEIYATRDNGFEIYYRCVWHMGKYKHSGGWSFYDLKVWQVG